jgi:ATP-dependent protease ClpP protease subunit
MDHYQQMMVQIVADGSKLAPDRIHDMMRNGALLSPKDALEVGLVHKIVDYKVDRSSRFWTV